MKQKYLSWGTFLVLLLSFACNKEHLLIGKFYPINFEKTSLQIGKEGGSAITVSQESDWWEIICCTEIAAGDTLIRWNEFLVINEINAYRKDTMPGGWYTAYKKGEALVVEFDPNPGETERSLIIQAGTYNLIEEFITITQE